MSEEGKFWAYMWTLAVLFIILVMIIVAISNGRNKDKIEAMVNQGVNPIVARCAVEGPGSQNVAEAQMCIKAAEFGNK